MRARLFGREPEHRAHLSGIGRELWPNQLSAPAPQRNVAVGKVFVPHATHEFDMHAEFFAHLADGRFRVALTRIHSATGKANLEGRPDTFAAANEKPAAIFALASNHRAV